MPIKHTPAVPAVRAVPESFEVTVTLDKEQIAMLYDILNKGLTPAHGSDLVANVYTCRVQHRLWCSFFEDDYRSNPGYRTLPNTLK